VIDDIPGLFGALSLDLFDFEAWQDINSPTLEIIGSTIRNNRVGMGISASETHQVVVVPEVEYTFVSSPSGGGNWRPTTVGFSHYEIHPRDARILAFGAGIHNDLGMLKIIDSSVTGNLNETRLGSFGGGISTLLGAVRIENSHINDNQANATTILCSGGAMHSFASYVQASKTEMKGNSDADFSFPAGRGEEYDQLHT
jgi:hypothetical protein